MFETETSSGNIKMNIFGFTKSEQNRKKKNSIFFFFLCKEFILKLMMVYEKSVKRSPPFPFTLTLTHKFSRCHKKSEQKCIFIEYNPPFPPDWIAPTPLSPFKLLYQLIQRYGIPLYNVFRFLSSTHFLIELQTVMGLKNSGMS